MTFNSDQLAMALYLTILAVVNFFFVYSSVNRIIILRQRRRKPLDDCAKGEEEEAKRNHLQERQEASRRRSSLSHATLAMALFDIPWIYLCMVQCWNNTFNTGNELDQGNGNGSFGCKFMGWYMGFGLIAMMGSHCLVAYYLRNYLKNASCNNDKMQMSIPANMSTVKSVWILALGLLILASCFVSMPLWQGDGYRMTNAGFCYPDFTQPTQSGIMLALVVFFLSLATVLWYQIGKLEYWCKFYLIYVVTWSFWIPACSYGIAVGKDIPPPYLIIAAFLSHGNALANSFLYGMHLFQILDRRDFVDSCSSDNNKEPFLISGSRIINKNQTQQGKTNMSIKSVGNDGEIVDAEEEA